MSKEVFSEVVYSKNVIEFVTVANEYCSFVETVDHFTRKDFLLRIQKLFPLLYLKASLLPEPDSELPDEVAEKFIGEDDYNFILNKLVVKFGEFDAYQEIYDSSLQYSYIPVEGSIAENITDIYQDLKDFILAYRIGTVEVMNDALRECRTNYEQYWGQRLVNGLRAIHYLLYSNVILEEEDKSSGKSGKK
jgi:hypothetical protein